MSFGDAKMPIVCDECFDEVLLDMEYRYRSMSGKSGQYVEPEELPEGWIETDIDKHLCPDCSQDGKS